MNIKKNTSKVLKNIFLKENYLEIEGGQSLEGIIKISGAKTPL